MSASLSFQSTNVPWVNTRIPSRGPPPGLPSPPTAPPHSTTRALAPPPPTGANRLWPVPPRSIHSAVSFELGDPAPAGRADWLNEIT